MSQWYDEVFGGARYGLRVSDVLFEGQSPYQKVEVLDTELWGRTLVIDGIFMTSERDEHFYHEMLVHPALTSAPRIRRVLVIGGGDGGTAREVLRHPEVEQVVMVEIDGMVVDASRTHLPGLGAWDDPRLDLRIGDGIAYVKETEEGPFDVVLLDGTDPVGPGEGLFNRAFYEGVRRVLAKDGVFALQSESPVLLPGIFFEIQETLAGVFPEVHPYFGPVPLYSAGQWSWTWASRRGDPLRVDERRLAAIADGCKQYTAELHRASFAQPAFVRRRLRGPAGA